MAWNLPFVESRAIEVRMHEDAVDSDKPKALNTLFGFILPNSVVLLSLLEYFVIFAANYCYICIGHRIFIGSSRSPGV